MFDYDMIKIISTRLNTRPSTAVHATVCDLVSTLLGFIRHTVHTSGCFSAKVLKPACFGLCLPDKDETRSQSVARTAVDGRVFSVVLMYDGEIISALLLITNALKLFDD